MPWITPWHDPDTGATFPQSYARPDDPQPDPLSGRVTIGYKRWASQTAYSMGYVPIQVVATQISGSLYQAVFASQYQQAQQQMQQQLRGVAVSFIAGLTEFSGALVSP